MAEWVKMAIAPGGGMQAAAAVQLPARFQWQTYRRVLGRAQVPGALAARQDRARLAADAAAAEVLAEPASRRSPATSRITTPAAAVRSALHIADLYDVYQVPRPDWLDAWGEGREALPDADRGGLHSPAAAGPAAGTSPWQARLWQRVVDAEAHPQQRALARPQLHDRVLARSTRSRPPPRRPPRRLSSCSSAPTRAAATLQLLAAVSRHAQVLARRRLPPAASAGPTSWTGAVAAHRRHRQPLHAPPSHGTSDWTRCTCRPPLLAAWGRQAPRLRALSSTRLRRRRADARAASARPHRPLRRRPGHPRRRQPTLLVRSSATSATSPARRASAPAGAGRGPLHRLPPRPQPGARAPRSSTTRLLALLARPEDKPLRRATSS